MEQKFQDIFIKKIDKSFLFDFELPKKERKHLIEKASICVNGISLTISKVTKKVSKFGLYLIHIRKQIYQL